MSLQQSGYNVHVNETWRSWHFAWNDVLLEIFREADQRGEDCWTVYALNSGKPKLILMCGGLGNKFAMEVLENA